MDVPPRGPLIRFGKGNRFSDGLFIAPSTGEVIECAYGNVRTFVNSSLDLFARTVSAVVNRFPFFSNHAEDEEIVNAAKELATIIRRIDPPAMVVDLFWSSFVDDVGMGDYTTEQILEWNGLVGYTQ